MSGVTTENIECEISQSISEQGKLSKPPQLTSRGKLLFSVAGGVFAGISALLLPFVFPGFRKVPLPYLPTSKNQVKNVMTALLGRSGSMIDIGSGDGRLTLLAAQKGFSAYGVELNSWLVLLSKLKAWRQGLSGEAKFCRKDLWKTDLSPYQNIVVFGVEAMMDPLEEKLSREMSPDALMVSCRFPLPTWQPVSKIGDGIDVVWVYAIPDTDTASSRKD